MNEATCPCVNTVNTVHTPGTSVLLTSDSLDEVRVSWVIVREDVIALFLSISPTAAATVVLPFCIILSTLSYPVFSFLTKIHSQKYPVYRLWQKLLLYCKWRYVSMCAGFSGGQVGFLHSGSCEAMFLSKWVCGAWLLAGVKPQHCATSLRWLTSFKEELLWNSVLLKMLSTFVILISNDAKLLACVLVFEKSDIKL